MASRPHIDVGIRIQCLFLLEYDVPIDMVSFIKKVIANVCASVAGRCNTITPIGHSIGIGATSVQKILKRNGFHKVKRTMKSRLTDTMKEACL